MKSETGIVSISANPGIVFKPVVYECPKHGKIGDETIISTLPGNEARLCLHCYIEKLIEIGVCSVTKIE